MQLLSTGLLFNVDHCLHVLLPSNAPSKSFILHSRCMLPVCTQEGEAAKQPAQEAAGEATSQPLDTWTLPENTGMQCRYSMVSQLGDVVGNVVGVDTSGLAVD